MKEYVEVLKKYAVFEGRATRREYWMFTLVHTLIIIASIFMLVFSLNFVTIIFLYVIATWLPSLAVTVRRLHDSGKSGWWILLNFVPSIGQLVLFIFTILESETCDNAYGSYTGSYHYVGLRDDLSIPDRVKADFFE